MPCCAAQEWSSALEGGIAEAGAKFERELEAVTRNMGEAAGELSTKIAGGCADPGGSKRSYAALLVAAGSRGLLALGRTACPAASSGGAPLCTVLNPARLPPPPCSRQRAV